MGIYKAGAINVTILRIRYFVNLMTTNITDNLRPYKSKLISGGMVNTVNNLTSLTLFVKPCCKPI